MDFLDPRKRRAHSIRLLVGYVLVAIAIGLAAMILRYAAEGYGINTKNGEIVQNGLLFVDSQPGGADVYLNNHNRGVKTASRLVLPAGSYQLAIKKDGYKDWQRKFSLTEHSIARYVYPLLFPQKPRITALKTYPSHPPLIAQSPDQHWLLVQNPDSPGLAFDQYDTADLTKPPQTVELSPALLSGQGAFTLVEWSTDNKNLLLQHDYPGGKEFIIFNRDKPAESANVNKSLNLNPSMVSLRNKKAGQLYIFDSEKASLSSADLSNGQVSPVLENVLAFKSSGSNLISYITDAGAPDSQVNARILDGNKSFALATIAKGSRYLLDEAQFQNHWYYVAGSDASPLVNIYKDPLNIIKKAIHNKAVPMLSLNVAGTEKVSFSANTRFVAAQAGQSLAVYDLEEKNFYHYTLTAPLAGMLHWADGHRLIGNTNQQVFVADYDSTNQVIFVPSDDVQGGFFDHAYEHLITTTKDSTGRIVLENVDMRAGKDLPKQ